MDNQKKPIEPDDMRKYKREHRRRIAMFTLIVILCIVIRACADHINL